MKLATNIPLAAVLAAASIAAIGIVAHAIEMPTDTTKPRVCESARVIHVMPTPTPVPPPPPVVEPDPIDPDPQIRPPTAD